jgi:uncharacterized protein (TIRG00374 family)
VVSAVCILVVIRSVDLGAAARVLSHAAIAPLAAGLAFLLVSLGIRVAVWTTLLPPSADGRRVPPRRVAPVLLIGYLGNVVLPARLGEVIRSYLIDRREGVPFGGALGSVVLERVLDTTALAVLAFIAAEALAAPVWIVRGMGLLAAGGTLVVIILATTGLAPALRLLARLAGIAPLRRPIEGVVRRLEHFVYWSGGAHRRRQVALVIVLGAAAWMCNAAMFWCIGVSVDAALTPAGACLVMATTVLATAIPSAPAYVGTFELAAVTVAGFLGVPAETALALALLAHAMGTLPAAVGGAISLGAMGGSISNLSAAAVEAERHELEAP